MKIKVLHFDGRIEQIECILPIGGYEGQQLDRLVCGDGLEHFFDKSGFYDGWGRGFSGSVGEGVEIIQGAEKQRKIESREN
jgi:hypothetical protein